MVRDNPQWRTLESQSALTVAFQGPHAHVSPGWYHSSGVPTWNYTVVHVRGRARLFEVIVGFEIEIQSVQAKFKLSQNRPLQDQQAVIRHLARSVSAADQALSAFMQHYSFAQPE